MLHHFCDVKFQAVESVRHLTEQVFHLLLQDSELPVKVDAALALQFLVKYQVLCEWEGRERRGGGVRGRGWWRGGVGEVGGRGWWSERVGLVGGVEGEGRVSWSGRGGAGLVKLEGGVGWWSVREGKLLGWSVHLL